jgi:hypothetical protein
MSVSCDCCVLFRYRCLRQADPSSRRVLPSVCVCVNGVIRCINNPLHLQCRGQIKKESKLQNLVTKRCSIIHFYYLIISSYYCSKIALRVSDTKCLTYKYIHSCHLVQYIASHRS